MSRKFDNGCWVTRLSLSKQRHNRANFHGCECKVSTEAFGGHQVKFLGEKVEREAQLEMAEKAKKQIGGHGQFLDGFESRGLADGVAAGDV